MKIFIVLTVVSIVEDDDVFGDVVGAFSTLEKAEACRDAVEAGTFDPDGMVNEGHAVVIERTLDDHEKDWESDEE